MVQEDGDAPRITPYFFNCTICLHPALFTCTTLIISLLRCAGSLVFHLHTACACLHAVCTYFYTCLHVNVSAVLSPRQHDMMLAGGRLYSNGR